MNSPEFLAPVGQAWDCPCVGHHVPTPRRYVWHHILPRACGGLTVESNLVSLCDTAHYAIHDLLWWLKQNGGVWMSSNAHANRVLKDLAMRGYQEAVAKGTVDKIPRED